ncbi:MAG: hypothetical protein K6G26_04625 [Lachnospiraceae bacterium]|nr:hypothetical protein [Lachnospiraceae bacterium]
MKLKKYFLLAMGIIFIGTFGFLGNKSFAKKLDHSSYELNREYSDIIPEKVTEYAESRFEGLSEIVTTKKFDFGVDVKKTSEIKLQKPFVIYSSESLGTQDAIYYYPITKNVI